LNLGNFIVRAKDPSIIIRLEESLIQSKDKGLCVLFVLI
jgi:hypothetical protein